jgi:hypothetical protein
MPVEPPSSTNTYWKDVLQQTSGYNITAGADHTSPSDNEIPYHFLLGSDGGLDDSVNSANADSLFPTFTGVGTKKLPPPPASQYPDFATDFAKTPDQLDPDIFLSWHSAHQLEYIQRQTTVVDSGSTTGGNVKYAVIGTGGNTITVVAANDGLSLYVVEQLQKRDFAVMPRADQVAISLTNAFTRTGGVAEKFGFTTNQSVALNGDGVSGSPNERSVQDTIDDIEAQFSPKPSNFDINDPNTYPAPRGLMTYQHALAFLDQLNFIKNKIVNNMAIYSMADIVKATKEIETRFKRAYEFGNVPAEINSLDTNPKQTRNVVSLDGGATIREGYKAFIQQELKLRDLQRQRDELASSGFANGKQLDVPTLVFLLQLQYNLTTEAKSTAETQEINQQNALLKTYAEMQRIVNHTVKNFNHKDNEDDRAVFGFDGTHFTSEIGDADAKVLSMFEDYISAANVSARHPLEKLRGITRPLEDLYVNASVATNHRLNEYLKPHWDAFNTQLSDTVTLINQESQIKMNDINSMDKQKNRHFDLANSALQKLNEMIQNIARATA